MGTPRLIPFGLALFMGVGAAGAQSTAQAPSSDGEGLTREVNASSVMLPCIPVAAYWTGPPPSEGMSPVPIDWVCG